MNPTQKDIECAEAVLACKKSYGSSETDRNKAAQLVAQRVADETKGLREALHFINDAWCEGLFDNNRFSEKADMFVVFQMGIIKNELNALTRVREYQGKKEE